MPHASESGAQERGRLMLLDQPPGLPMTWTQLAPVPLDSAVWVTHGLAFGRDRSVGESHHRCRYGVAAERCCFASVAPDHVWRSQRSGTRLDP